MKKYLFIFVAILLSVTILLVYKIFTIKTSNLVNTDALFPKIYINTFEPKEDMYTFYQYAGLLPNNKPEILLKKNIGDYTTFAYSKLHNKLYFVDKAKDNTMQLFVKNLKMDQLTQLTNELSSVDFVQIDKEEKIIFMRTLLKGDNRNFHLATYDIATGKLKVWDETDKDRSVLNFNYSPINNKLIVVSFSVDDDTKKLEIANENNKPLLPSRYSLDIYNVNGEKEKHVDVVEKFISGASFSPDKNSVLLSFDETLNSSVSHVIEVDVNTKQVKEVLTSDPKHLKIRAVNYDENKEGFFFLSSLNDNKKSYNALELPKESVLSYYDIKEKKIQDIWSINNGIIVSYSIGIK